jgi:uncharacterized membrane protein YeaQ/YmgE (transglycosylase-associated protein family)
MGVIWFLLFGLIVGFIARALMPGRQKMGLLMTMLLGVAGSLLGGFVGNLIGGREATGPSTAGFIGSLIGAFVILLVITAVSRRRRVTTV